MSPFDYVKEILVLKSAFSIVDQMFEQEIENAEIIKKNWFRHIFCWRGSLNIKEPETLNKFISGIMDPFKDKEEDDDAEEEQEDEMSLYKFKLAGLISGKDSSYISLVNSSGEVISVTLGQYLGKIKLVDLRLNEAIFEKDDKKFIIIDFNNIIREADEY